MKKTGLLTLALLASMALLNLQSCSNDGDEGPSNYFSYEQDTYQLNKAGTKVYKPNNGVYSHAIEATTSGIVFETVNDTIKDFSGKGDIIYFALNTSSEKNIEPGTYNFDKDSDNPFSVSGGAVVLDFDLDLAEEDDDYEPDTRNFISGTVTVKEQNGEYDFTWNFKDKDGKEITGNYHGNLFIFYGEYD